MENVNRATHEKLIAVAVKGKPSQLALKWTVENLAKETKSILLIHAKRKSVEFVKPSDYDYGKLGYICGEEVAQGLEQCYKDTLSLQVKEMFGPFIMYCEKKNVHYEEVVIEDDDIARGITDYVLKHNIDVVVLGAGSRGGFFRGLKGPDKASKIAKSAPYFCTVYTVGKGGVATIKSASTSTSTQNLSTVKSVKIQEPVIGNHVPSVNSQLEPRISVGARESHLQPKPAKEFEFRSPLGNCKDSDFPWEGHPPSDSDISFISSDKQFFDRMSSGYSSNSSNVSFGSLDSWQTPTSSSTFTTSSAKISSDSYSSLGTMDEMRRLQLELMQTKKLYAAACQEALDAESQASKLKPFDTENRCKLVNEKGEAAVRIKNIVKRISELKSQHIR